MRPAIESFMKTLFLHQDVYACQTTDGAVFMNLESGQYFGLDIQATDIITPFIEGWPTSGVRGQAVQSIAPNTIELTIEALTTHNRLLTDSPKMGRSASFPNVLATSAIPLRGNIIPRPRVGGIHVLAFCRACIRALFDIKFRSMAYTVRRLQTRKARYCSTGRDEADLVELVRIFRFLTPLVYTAKDRCLFDSLALIEFLAAFRWFPTWIIGVTTRPFKAHSWIQNEGLILNDRLETVELYSPILAV
jgi:Transglutaminase-like superfamily